MGKRRTIVHDNAFSPDASHNNSSGYGNAHLWQNNVTGQLYFQKTNGVWIEFGGGTTGTGTTGLAFPISKTYAELSAMKTAGTFVVGQLYLLTDYRTRYTDESSVTFTSTVTEPLMLTAIKNNQLSNICSSTLYPQDIVYYEITANLGTGVVAGFDRGMIYRRIDTIKNNDVGTDWRHIKYNIGGTYKLLFTVYSNAFNNTISGVNPYYSTIDFGCVNNRIGGGFYRNTIGGNMENNIIDANFQLNTIGGFFTRNRIQDNFQQNTIGDHFEGNNVGNYFQQNHTLEFTNNIIGNGMTNNTMLGAFYLNKIGNDFTGNTCGNNFINNIIGTNFSANGTIGDYFQNNVIAYGFSYNTVTASQFMNITTKSSVQTKNLASIAELHNKVYPHEIGMNSSNNNFFTYINGSNVLVTTAIP